MEANPEEECDGRDIELQPRVMATLPSSHTHQLKGQPFPEPHL